MSDASADDRGTTPLRRHWRRWCLIAAVLLVGVWFARFSFLRITRRPTPRPEYWIAKIAELDPPPPGAVSAAEAQRLLIAAPWITDATRSAWFDFDVLDVLAGAWDPTRIYVWKVGAVFRTQAFIDARARVRRLARAGWMSPPEIEFETRFTLPYRRWRWSSLLTVHSRWVREQNGDLDTCVDDWLSALQLARQLRRSRQVETWRSALSATSTVVWEMWVAAGELRSPLDVRSLAMRIDEICGPVLRPSDLLAGERLAMHAELERWFVREGGQWLVVNEHLANNPSFGWPTPPAAPRVSRLWNLGSPLFHDLTTARATISRYFAELNGFSGIGGAAELQTGAGGWPQPPVLSLLDGFPEQILYRLRSRHASILLSYYQGRCEMEAALALLALHQYRLTHGSYPKRLGDVVPDYLPRLPIDCVDGQPLRYRVIDDAYVLYSIGLNGRDDGGLEQPDADSPWKRSNPDAVFGPPRRTEKK